MADIIKRLNYFTGQFLDAQDFRDEQTYLNEMRWRDNNLLLSAGVRSGLVVAATPDNKGVTVSAGVAFDSLGRELVVPALTPPPVYAIPAGMTGLVRVVISYEPILTDSHSVGGYTGATRVTENAKVEIKAGAVTAPQIPLAVLQLDANGVIQSVSQTTADPTTRQLSALNANAAGIGTSSPRTTLEVQGGAMISDGNAYAMPNKRMKPGSLTLGSIAANFGGGSGWNDNTAGLLLETLDDTEVAVHDSGTRITSLLHYKGAANAVTIGRDMGWGPPAALNVSAPQLTGVNASFTGSMKVGGILTWGLSDTRTEGRNDAGAEGVGVRSGFYQADTPVNFPAGATSWWHLLDVRHSNPANNYAMQFAGSFSDQALWFRKTNNDGATAWQRALLADAAGRLPSPLAVAGVGATLELGAGVADKEANAGKIAFRAFGDQLDIVGGGTNSERRIKLWAEQGTTFTGDLTFGTGNPVAGATLSTPLRMHLGGGELCYLLHLNGTIVSKAWGGSGRLEVEGDVRLGSADAKVYIGGNQDGAFMALHDDLWFADMQNGTIELWRTETRPTVANSSAQWGSLKGLFVNASSIEYKKDVATLDTPQLSRILDEALRTDIVSFRYHGDASTDRERLGVIAERCPDYLLSADGQGVVIAEHVAMLHAALKAMANQIDELKRTVEDLSPAKPTKA